MSKTFCPRPWIHQQIQTSGGIKICCVSTEVPTNNAATANLKEVYNNETLKRVRKNILNGEWDPVCVNCKDEEAMGLETARVHEIKDWADRFTFEDAVATTHEDGSVDYGPRYWDLRFGNFCNIKCRMCGPYNSHSWYEEWSEYYGSDSFDTGEKVITLVRNAKGRFDTNYYDWPKQEHFWNQMTDNIDTAEYVFMAGGEPFLIERQEQFLKECIDRGRASSMTLAYNTNLTSLPDRLVELWKHFKLVRVGASIDAMGEVLYYQRYPSNWDAILKNLHKLDGICRENLNIVSAITATITTCNVFQFPEYIWWKVNDSGFTNINNFEDFPVIMYHMAHGPETSSIQIFPKHIKEQIRSKYNEYIAKFEGNTHAVNMLKNVLVFMDAEDKSEHIPEFIKFTKFLDNSRGQDLAKVVPELAELIQG